MWREFRQTYISCFLERDILDLCCRAVFSNARSWKFLETGIIGNIWTLSTASWEREMSFIVVQMLPTEPAKYPNQAAAVQMVQMAKYPNQIKLKVNSSVSFWVVPVHPLWINQWWCSTTILHLIGLNDKKKLFLKPSSCILRKMVQSPINYSVHVVVSGPRHPCTTC